MSSILWLSFLPVISQSPIKISLNKNTNWQTLVPVMRKHFFESLKAQFFNFQLLHSSKHDTVKLTWYRQPSSTFECTAVRLPLPFPKVCQLISRVATLQLKLMICRIQLIFSTRALINVEAARFVRRQCSGKMCVCVFGAFQSAMQHGGGEPTVSRAWTTT